MASKTPADAAPADSSWLVRRRRALTLAALLLLALLLRFTGLHHEIADRPWLDEGTYVHHAQQVRGGEPWSATFVYPHLTYYAEAALLRLQELVEGPWAALCREWLGITNPLERTWLWLRGYAALLGALVVLPVYLAAERLAAGGRRERPALGWAAGTVAGLLIVVSPLVNRLTHVNISDGPAAVFAAFCFAAAVGLLDRESARGYLLAGVAGGLAAASKYPAGLVVVAVFAVWLRHRLGRGGGGSGDERGTPWGLLWAALAALAVFLAATPSFFVFPEAALHGDRGVLFGVRQYAGGGWIGVQPRSNLGFYGGLLLHQIGWPALLAAVAGVALAGRELRRRLAWAAPFPVLYLALVCAMTLVVPRNLLPAVPPLAVFAGVGVASAGSWLWERWGAARRIKTAAATAAALLLVAVPAVPAVTASLAMAAPSTLELAREWMVENLPPGTFVLREEYTPNLPGEHFVSWKSRFAARVPREVAREEGVDYVVLASTAYSRFFDPEARTEEHHDVYLDWYRRTFAELPELLRVEPDRLRWGPEVRVFRLPPAEDTAAGPFRFAAGAIFVPDGAMRREDGGVVQFYLPGQWISVKPYLPPGRYRVRVEGEGALDGRIWMRPVGEAGTQRRSEGPVTAGVAEVEVEEAGWTVLYLAFEEGVRVTAVELLLQPG